MILKMFIAYFLLVVLVSAQSTIDSIQVPSTDAVGNLLTDYPAFSLYYQGFYLTKITGYNDRPFVTAPWHLQRLELTFSSLPGAPKPSSKIMNIGTGFRSPLDQPIAGSISFKFVKSIRLGFDKIGLCYFQVTNENNIVVKFGTQPAFVYYFSVPIDGYLGGVKGQAATGISSIGFFLLPIPCLLNSDFESSDAELRKVTPSIDVYLSQINGFSDRLTQNDPYQICRIEFVYKGIFNKTLTKNYKIGQCNNTVEPQTASGSINLSFGDEGTMNVGYSSSSLARIWFERRNGDIQNIGDGAAIQTIIFQRSINLAGAWITGSFGLEAGYRPKGIEMHKMPIGR